MASGTKVLLLGIDGAPYDLLLDWIRDGDLPHFKKLAEEGAFGPLDSLLDVTPPAWSSIYSGKNPGKHGIFGFMQHRYGSYQFAHVNSTQRDSLDIWELIGATGLKVGVVNAPITFPPRPVNGFLITGFMTPGEGAAYTFPASLKADLKKEVPGFRPSYSDQLIRGLGKEAYTKSMVEKIENLRSASLRMLAREEYPFYAVFISETDHVQHWYWSEMVGSDGVRNGAPGERPRAILETYKAADRLLGSLLDSIDDNTVVLVVSDHGGTMLSRFFHTNYFLYSIGLLNFKNTLRISAKKSLFGLRLTRWFFRAVIQSRFYLLRYLLKPFTLSVSDIDWDRTVAYSLGYGQVFLNVVGREPHGALRADKVEETKKLIREQVERLRDEGGKRPVMACLPKEDIFQGPHAEEAPDLQLDMAEGYEAFPWSGISGSVFTDGLDRSGTHNTRGVVMINGKGIARTTLGKVSVVDIAPTILNVMGLPIPRDMDGKVIREAMTDEFQSSHPVEFGPVTSGGELQKYEMSEAEQHMIEENLRSLGYM